MSIRTLRNASGAIVGYQAFAGSGGAGLTSYVPATNRNAQAVLAAAETMLAEIHKASTALKPLRDPLTGLRLVLHRGRKADSIPVLYVDAVWRVSGRNVHRCYSTERNGRLDAVVMAVAEMDRGTGVKLGISPRAVLAELMARHERTNAYPIPRTLPNRCHVARSVFELASY